MINLWSIWLLVLYNGNKMSFSASFDEMYGPFGCWCYIMVIKMSFSASFDVVGHFHDNQSSSSKMFFIHNFQYYLIPPSQMIMDENKCRKRKNN